MRECGWYRGRVAFRPQLWGGRAFFIYKKGEVQCVKKYQPLMEYLENCGQERITLPYGEIEKIIGGSLPPSSRDPKSSWWANNITEQNRQSRAWLDAGYKVIDKELGVSITFEKQSQKGV